MTDKTTKYEILLSEFAKVPQKTKEKSFISICGFPSMEKVSSNILAFFLDTHKEHNLKNLFVKSLLESVGLNADEYPEDFESETEVYTKNGKYIDLLLRNEKRNIVIENKIYAKLYNPLNDYYETASEEGKEEPIGIVLSLFPIEESKKTEISEKFYFVTYQDFFNKVKENIGNYLEKANQKYIPFLQDYFDNIWNLERGENMDIDKEFFEFLREHEADTEKFAGKIEKFRKYLRKKVTDINQSLEGKIKGKNVKIWPYRENQHLFDTAVVDYYPNYPNKDVDVAIDSRLTLNGWKFFLWIRADKSNRLDDYIKKMDQYPDMKGIITDGRFRFDKIFDFNAEIEDVSDFIVDIINKLH